MRAGRAQVSCASVCPLGLRQRLGDVQSRARLAWPHLPPRTCHWPHTPEPELLRAITAQQSLALWCRVARCLPRAVPTAFGLMRTLGGHGDTMQQKSSVLPSREWCPFRPDSPRWSLFKWKFCKSTSAACVVQFGWQQFLAKEITKLLFSHGFLTAAKQVDVN